MTAEIIKFCNQKSKSIYISATKNNSVNISQVKETLKYKETLKRLPNYFRFAKLTPQINPCIGREAQYRKQGLDNVPYSMTRNALGTELYAHLYAW